MALNNNNLMLLLVLVACTSNLALAKRHVPSSFIHVSTKIAPEDADPKLKFTCMFTDNPELCITTILPKLKGGFTPEKAIAITIGATTDYAKLGPSLTKNLPELQECKQSYLDASAHLVKASAAFNKKDLDTAQMLLREVIDDVDACQEKLKEVGEAPELAKFAENLTNLMSNSVSLIATLEAN